MDFRQSGSTPVNRTEQAPASTAPAQQHAKQTTTVDNLPKWLNVMNVVILFGVAILLALISLSFTRTSGSTNEISFVDSSKYQAVFLNNGQVYFGDVATLNNKYLRLNNIYYLTQNTTAAASGQQQTSGDYTLVKLGCQQIHYPTDQMIINRDQITFWENLSKDGKVAKSIEEFKKQNPNGPDCSKVSDQTQSSSTAGAQGSNTPSNTTQTTKP